MTLTSRMLLLVLLGSLSVAVAREVNLWFKHPNCSVTETLHAFCDEKQTIYCKEYCDGEKECSGICIVPECVCKEGYVRNVAINNTCVPKLSCPGACGENAHYETECPGCERSCDERWACDRNNCGSPKCECNENYARDEHDKCIKIEECPNYPCHKGEKMSKCGGCENKCDRRMVCKTGLCARSCECISGFARHNNATCVPIDQCEKCGENEVFDFRCTKCEAWCGKNEMKDCEDCPPQCRCKDGYARNDQEKCVLRSECPTTAVTVLDAVTVSD